MRSLDAALFILEQLPERLGPVLVQELGSAESTDLLGIAVLRRKYKLVPFAVGKHSIPSLAVEVVGTDGSSIKGETPGVSLLVTSVSTEEDGPNEIKALKDPLVPEEEEQAKTVTLLIAALVLAAILAAGVIFYFIKKSMPSSLRKMIQLTPAERALLDLELLASSNLLSEGQAKQFFTTLSEIIRRYLGLRYHILALEMTSTELTSIIKTQARENGNVLTSLTSLLSVCDLVKFAKLIPPTEKGDEGIESARSIVQITRDDVAKENEGGSDSAVRKDGA